MHLIAILQDGPLRGQRREIESDQYGLAPRVIEVSHPRSTVSYRYELARSSMRARHWVYLYRPIED